MQILPPLEKRQTRMRIVKHPIYGERGVYLLSCPKNLNRKTLEAIAVLVRHEAETMQNGKVPRKVRIEKTTLLKVVELKNRSLRVKINYKHKKPILIKLSNALSSLIDNIDLIQTKRFGIKLSLYLGSPIASELEALAASGKGPGFIAKDLELNYSKESIRFYLRKPY